jgi:hypothetical protein
MNNFPLGLLVTMGMGVGMGTEGACVKRGPRSSSILVWYGKELKSTSVAIPIRALPNQGQAQKPRLLGYQNIRSVCLVCLVFLVFLVLRETQ